MSQKREVSLSEALQILDEDRKWRRFQVDYPEAELGSFRIETFGIARLDRSRLRYIVKEGIARDPGWGTFRRLVEVIPGAGEDGADLRRTWMSDTRAEVMEHAEFFNRLLNSEKTSNKRILINGLGLGVVVHGALTYGGITHIDVVERNPDVIELVGQFVTADPRVTIHLGDAYAMRWPSGTRWDFAWHDIWPTIDDENLPGMDRLMGKYKGRVAWQGCWQRKGCLEMDRIFRQMKAGTLPPARAFEILQGNWRLP